MFSLRKATALLLASASFLVLFNGCKKTEEQPPVVAGPITNPVDDATQVTASVTGVVLDENGAPLAAATVRCGNQSTTTNATGTFFFRNIQVSKNNASVSVTKSGYFKGIRNFLAAAGKSHYTRIKLMRQTLTATISASAGGLVDLGNGASISFPANAFAYPNGTPYTGNVQVYGKYINPQDPALHLIVPGDLRGIRTNGQEGALSSYGMIGAELLDASGQPLVIASGKTAGLEFPIPTAVQPAIVDTIPLWHFDEGRGRWLEEGVATKSSGKIKAGVSKFSFWNIDQWAGYVPLSCVIMNSIDSTPVANQLVTLNVPGTSMTCYGYTACTGFLISGVPLGQTITMQILTANSCATTLHTRTIGPFSSATNLDTIWITAPTNTYTVFSGQIKNCQGAVASNSYITLYSPTAGTYIFQPDSATGAFEIPVYTCQNTTLSYSYQASEFGTNQQSPVLTGSTSAHTVNLGAVFACATQPVTTTDVYVFGDEKGGTGKQVIKYWKNGVATHVTDGSSSCYSYDAFMTPSSNHYIAGVEWDAGGTTSFARLWVDGVKTDIGASTIINSTATGVFVNGADVYVSYTSRNLVTGYSTAKLWKNGTRSTLADSAANFNTTCVYVSGNDVYVGGSRTPNASTVSRAVIWKNGVAQYLNGGQFNSTVNKILVVGPDVYAVGQDNLGANGTGRAVIWKNGVPTYLTDGTGSDAMANDIFIDGTDIYVCGRKSSGSGEKAQLWKNGVATVLSASGSNGIAQSVYVKNGDVYVAETGFLSGPVRLWKNSIPTLLTTGANFNSACTVLVR